MLIGGNTASRLEGGDGDDILAGALGADQLIGGAGIDTASYEDNQGSAIVNLMTGATGGGAAGDTFDSIENLVGAPGFADQLTGTDGPNDIYGLGNPFFAADVLNGAGGDDRLFGGDGPDVLIGGPGADLLHGGADGGTASYQNNGAPLTIDLVNFIFTGEAIGDTYIGIIALTGTNFSDTLIAAAEGTVRSLGGLGGDDILVGSTFGGSLSGGDGNDSVTGGARQDVLDGGNGNDTLIGGGFNDLLRGGAGNDTIDAGEGVDQMFGGDGDDLLRGGAGNDVLNGGSGVDTYVFAEGDTGTGVGSDRIQDFGSGVEKIDLSGIDASSLAGGDQAFSFIGDGAFTGIAGQLRYFYNGVAVLQGDTNGDSIVHLEIYLDGVIPIASDFVL